MNRGPWNVISGQCNVIMRPCNVIMGQRNVNRGPFNLIMGRWNVNSGHGMSLWDRVMRLWASVIWLLERGM